MKSFKEYLKESSLISEGKHWPEDYVRTAKNIIKQSALGQQSWYSDDYIDDDLKTFVDKFSPLSHKNSNLGFFSPLIKWFVEYYNGSDITKYQEFIEGKLDNIIRVLQIILNDKSYDDKRDQLKKMSFKDFEKMMSDILAKSSTDSDAKLANIQQKDDYELIPIYCYDEFHDKFGGNKTGYKGQSEWCHTNGEETYDSDAWTSGGKNMFFVLAKKGWEKIKPVKTKNAFDKYGVSLIAILVDVQTTALKAETLRWNHVIEPSETNPGSSVDHAFKDNWGDLSQLVGFNVKKACEKYCKDLKNKLENEIKNANKTVEQILKSIDVIDANTIPGKLRTLITKIVIPDSVKRIDDYAFAYCNLLKEITIPDSVTSIGGYAFAYCNSLKEITISDSVTRIGYSAFSNCKSLKSITIPNSVTIISNHAFYGCESLKEITIPDSVKHIDDYAFAYCNLLKEITIPDSVTSISKYEFFNCNSLKGITIPDSVTRISNWAFAYCEQLKEITIPDSITRIDNSAFYKCESLKQVIFSSNSPLLNDIKNEEFMSWGLKKEQIFIKKV